MQGSAGGKPQYTDLQWCLATHAKQRCNTQVTDVLANKCKLSCLIMCIKREATFYLWHCVATCVRCACKGEDNS